MTKAINQKSILSLAIAGALSGVIGCSGGGSDDSVENLGLTPSDLSENTSTVTAIDGYLQNAAVMADTNENGYLDGDDYRIGLTNSMGQLEVSETFANRKLFVEVQPNDTIDSDTGVADAYYTLNAPAGSDVITPFTHLATFLGGMDAVAEALDLPKSAIEGDFIAKTNSETQEIVEQAQTVHALARFVVSEILSTDISTRQDTDDAAIAKFENIVTKTNKVKVKVTQDIAAGVDPTVVDYAVNEAGEVTSKYGSVARLSADMLSQSESWTAYWMDAQGTTKSTTATFDSVSNIFCLDDTDQNGCASVTFKDGKMKQDDIRFTAEYLSNANDILNIVLLDSNGGMYYLVSEEIEETALTVPSETILYGLEDTNVLEGELDASPFGIYLDAELGLVLDYYAVLDPKDYPEEVSTGGGPVSQNIQTRDAMTVVADGGDFKLTRSTDYFTGGDVYSLISMKEGNAFGVTASQFEADNIAYEWANAISDAGVYREGLIGEWESTWGEKDAEGNVILDYTTEQLVLSQAMPRLNNIMLSDDCGEGNWAQEYYQHKANGDLDCETCDFNGLQEATYEIVEGAIKMEYEPGKYDYFKRGSFNETHQYYGVCVGQTLSSVENCGAGDAFTYKFLDFKDETGLADYQEYLFENRG